ncbi:hypothetical protein [Sporosarcina pasteurii]|uniref:Yip1 domain n=1 Tax=Sporosarcina pasteurii TaxID=1474 RepID=A0A380BFH2_SPOPA|nr:hypothetical protein [Sporosarcina pasteurii]MDS9472439.1 hypothetical protein [Sporosarcina pasteurii]QBQ05997.1 hypothetical protein E2C16_10105 [Sporosarcina pasteurii]SUI99705.1 Uncharacterised protein [Sporosarcina pasteurii]
MECSHCGHKQNHGYYCGMCGVQLNTTGYVNHTPSSVTASNEQTNHLPATMESNVQFDQLKEKVIHFLQYFLSYFKNPTHIFKHKHEEYKNGIISILLFTMIVGLSFYNLALNNMYLTSEPSFTSYFGSFFVIILGFMMIGLLAVIIINHIFGPQFSYNSIISIYGAHLPLFTLLTLLSFILKSFSLGSTLLVMSVLFAIFVLPFYIMIYLLTNQSVGLDSFYACIIYLFTFSILLLLFLSFFGDSTKLQLFIRTVITY